MNFTTPYFSVSSSAPFVCSKSGMCFGQGDYKDMLSILQMSAFVGGFIVFSVLWTVWSLLGALRFTWRERILFLVFLYFLPEIMAYRIVKMPVGRHFFDWRGDSGSAALRF
jgi:hypothetical protein